jgi:uncharacterized protein (TIGR02246 family)
MHSTLIDPAVSAWLAPALEAMGRAYAAGDHEALLALYAEDAALVEPGKPVIHGQAAIAEELSDWFARIRFSAVRHVLQEAQPLGAAALEISVWSMQARRVDGGEASEESWRQLSLWVPQGHDWRLKRLMFHAHAS